MCWLCVGKNLAFGKLSFMRHFGFAYLTTEGQLHHCGSMLNSDQMAAVNVAPFLNKLVQP